MIVRHALQLQTPMSTAAMITVLSRITVHDFDLYFFIFGVFFEIVKHDVEVGGSHWVDEYATGGVFGFGTGMDTDALSFGYFLNDGQQSLELRRPRAVEGVCPSRNDEVDILDSRVRVGAFADGEGDSSVNGFAFLVLSG